MAIRMGKAMTEVICPLCQTIWFLELSEWNYVYDASDSKATFYCPECKKNIVFDYRSARTIRQYTNRISEYRNPIFYEE